MQIVTVESTAPVNPFAADVEALRLITEGDAANSVEAQPLAAGEFICAEDEVSKTKFKIGKAANAIDRTAALVSEVKRKDGVHLTYKIKARHRATTRNRKPKGETVDSTATEAVEATAE